MKRFALLLALFPLAGCRHRTPAPAIPAGAHAPVPPVAQPDTVAILPTLPVPPAPTPSRVPAAAKPPRRTRTASAPSTSAKPSAPTAAAPPPAPMASSAPEPNLLGILTVGGDQGAGKKQKATDLLADLDKRLKALSADTKSRQSEGLIRVRFFEREAQTALKAGDVEGAVTLATKARLLLDDLLK